MNPEKISSLKMTLPILAILLIIVGAIAIMKSGSTEEKESIVEVKTASSANPTVKKTETVPTGFPQDIPIEASNLKEGAVTTFQSNSAKQLSLSYTSTKSVTEKYAEYKKYLTQKGYSLTEGPANAQVRSIFGSKNDANLSVAISASSKGTLVQLSYLIK